MTSMWRTIGNVEELVTTSEAIVCATAEILRVMLKDDYFEGDEWYLAIDAHQAARRLRDTLRVLLPGLAEEGR